MKHLFALFALCLAIGTARAQTPVTKLPGEENLSLRERAERDFLMPVRRKKVVEAPRPGGPDDMTAAPENDATAHYSATADEVRPEEAIALAREARPTRSFAARHTAWLVRRAEARAEERAADLRAARRAEARRAARHSSSKRSSKATHSRKRSSKATHNSKRSSKAVKTKTKTKAARAKAAHTAKRSKSHHSAAKASHKTKKVTAHKKASHAAKATAKHKKKHRR